MVNAKQANRKWVIVGVAILVLFSCISFSKYMQQAISARWDQYLIERGYRLPPCDDPEDLPPEFEIYISRCEDPEILDFSLDGRYMLVYFYPEGVTLIHTISQERVILEKPQPFAFFKNNHLIFSHGLLDIETFERTPLEILNIENDHWPELIDAFETVYFINKSGSTLAVNSSVTGSDITGLYLDFDGRGISSRKRILLRENITYIEINSQYANCIISTNCISHTGKLTVVDRKIITFDNQTIIDLNDFPEEQIFPIGWSFNDHYIYFRFKKVQKPSFVDFFNMPSQPSGIARYKVPEEYWMP